MPRDGAAATPVTVCCVVPNWNGKESLRPCLDSLLQQTLVPHIIVVENGSTDGSLEFLRESYPQIELIVHTRNQGFAGGVNAGIRRAEREGARFVALFNNDAVADRTWLERLVASLELSPDVGIAAAKILDATGTHLDSTGDFYSSWGIPFPRGRDEVASAVYDRDTEVFGASGGASLYRVSMLQAIGLFDEDFFAYYEDVDLSFRAQLGGWKVRYVPTAVVFHQIGGTSGRIEGFVTYQAIKNLPWLLLKDVPGRLLPQVVPRFGLGYLGFLATAVRTGNARQAVKGMAVSSVYLPKKLWQRHRIQGGRVVTAAYIDSIMFHDPPPGSARLRRLRARWWKLRRVDL